MIFFTIIKSMPPSPFMSSFHHRFQKPSEDILLAKHPPDAVSFGDSDFENRYFVGKAVDIDPDALIKHPLQQGGGLLVLVAFRSSNFAPEAVGAPMGVFGEGPGAYSESGPLGFFFGVHLLESLFQKVPGGG